jgi:hypothetical protein
METQHKSVCDAPIGNADSWRASRSARAIFPGRDVHLNVRNTSSALTAALKSLPMIRKSVDIGEIIRCVYKRFAGSGLLFTQPRAPPVKTTVGKNVVMTLAQKPKGVDWISEPILGCDEACFSR